MHIDRQDLQRLIHGSGVLLTEGMTPSATGFANFAADVIDRCAAMVEAMRLREGRNDDVEDAYNVGIENSVDALRTASAILRRE